MSKYQKLAGDQVETDENDDIIIEPDFLKSDTANPHPKVATPLPPVTMEPQFEVPLSAKSKKVFEGGAFSLNYYRQYFDIDTKEFFQNCLQSLNPISEVPIDSFEENGDLYGSIWITGTLIFLLFFCNTLAEMISSILKDLDKPNVNYFKMLVSSINLLYGYTLLIPLAIYLVLWFYFKVPKVIPLTRVISIYSYANLLWIPATFLSIFRGILVNHETLGNILKWICVSIGGALSGASIIFKLKQYLGLVFDDEDDKIKLMILGVLIVAHIGFTIGIKVCFFGNL